MDCNMELKRLGIDLGIDHFNEIVFGTKRNGREFVFSAPQWYLKSLKERGKWFNCHALSF